MNMYCQLVTGATVQKGHFPFGVILKGNLYHQEGGKHHLHSVIHLI